MKFNFKDKKEVLRARHYLDKLSNSLSIHKVEIIAKRKGRTDDQNKWLWGCIYPMLLFALNNAGWEYTDIEQVHEFFKDRFTKDKVVNKETGEIIEFPRSTSKMTTLEFFAYCELLRAYAMDYLDLDIPEPNPNWKNEESQRKTSKKESGGS